MEKHELSQGRCIITNQAFVSSVIDAIGKPCSLQEIPDWSEIQPEVIIQNIDSPLFAYFRIPGANNVDPSSPLGVSVYSRAVELIRDADEIYETLTWEYAAGAMCIDASEDVFKRLDGKPELPKGHERLFRINSLDAANTSGDNLMKAWTPSLRDSNYIAGLKFVLSKIEDACNLSRGTLCEPTDVAKTATEMKITNQRTYAMVTDIQKSLETTLDDLVYAMYCLAILYDLCPDGKYTTTYIWDDSVVVDTEAERLRDQQEVAQGLMLPWEYRVKWYGEDETTAKQKLGYAEEMDDDEILDFSKMQEDKAE